MKPADLADYFGELDRQVKTFEPVAEAHKTAKERLLKLAEDSPADSSVVIAGRTWRVHFGKRSNERTITDQKKVFQLVEKRLGKDGAIAAVSLPMALVDKVATDSEQKTFIVREASGTRRIESVTLAESIPPAA
jgi:hypothetical protein